MAGFVEGVDRGQSTLFPALLDDYVSKTILCVRSTYSWTDLIWTSSALSGSSHSTRADPATIPA
jgi:hypothetical protein